MKRFVKIFAILCLVLLLTSCAAKRAKNEGYALYRSSPVGVEIEYPNFWEVADDKEERTAAFVSPNEGYSDTYRDNVTVVCHELGDEAMAYDNYVTTFINQLPSSINDYNKITEQEVALEGYEAYKVVYEGKTDERALRLSQTFIKSGKYVYILSFIAEPSSFSYFEKNAEVMLSTFKALRK